MYQTNILKIQGKQSGVLSDRLCIPLYYFAEKTQENE